MELDGGGHRAAAGNPSIGLWAFGLSLNGVPVRWGRDAAASGPALRNLGPNPGSVPREFEFDLPSAGRAVLSLYDLEARRVSTLATRVTEAGSYRMHWSVPGLPSGTYFVRL